MVKSDVLCFIVERDGASVPEIMHEFGATYSDARSTVEHMVKSGWLVFGGGLVFKPTVDGKEEAREYINERETRRIMEQIRAELDLPHETPAEPKDRRLARIKSKWDGITRELYNGTPDVPNELAENPSDDAERKDALAAEVEEKEIDALLEEITKMSLEVLESESYDDDDDDDDDDD